MVQRVHDWAERLVERFLEDRKQGINLDWPAYNCGWWAAQIVQEVTGENFYAPFEGHDTSALRMRSRLKELGHSTMSSYLKTLFPAKPLAFLTRGDLVLAPPAQGWESRVFDVALGIADPPLFWTITPEGIGTAPITEECVGLAVGEALCLQQ